MNSPAVSPGIALVVLYGFAARSLAAVPVLCIVTTEQQTTKAVPGHMSSFFGEVDPALQVGFAESFDIPYAALVTAAKAFAEYSGESYPLAA